MVNVYKDQHFLRPEEARFEPGESLSCYQLFILFLRKLSVQIIPNRMRSIHSKITSEYGKDVVKIFCKWEKIEYKMADFSNHRRFTLRCMSKNLIPVSVRLKSTFKTPKSKEIIRKAERALLNEQVRSINNSLTMFKELRDTCMNNLSTILEDERV